MVKNGWNAYLVETKTGQVGKRLNITSPSWTKPLDAICSGSVTAQSAELYQIEAKRFAPDYGSILLTYTYQNVERCIIAGPITGYPNETESTLQIDFTDIRGLLEDRLALYGNSVADKQSVQFKGMSLGTIAQEVVEATQDRPGGDLPIVYGIPREEFAGGNERNYEWFNVSNIIGDDVLTKLSEVVSGPDIMFRPEWANDNHTHIVWKMVHGTRHQTEIPQEWVPSFDVTSSKSGIISYQPYVSGGRRVNRVYITGAGEDAATTIGIYEDLESVTEGYPFREAVLSESDEERLDVLMEKAKQYVEQNKTLIREVAITIRADHPNYPLGRWDVGDRVKITVPQRHCLPAGTYDMIIIEAAGGEGGNVTIKLQEN